MLYLHTAGGAEKPCSSRKQAVFHPSGKMRALLNLQTTCNRMVAWVRGYLVKSKVFTENQAAGLLSCRSVTPEGKSRMFSLEGHSEHSGFGICCRRSYLCQNSGQSLFVWDFAKSGGSIKALLRFVGQEGFGFGRVSAHMYSLKCTLIFHCCSTYRLGLK